MSETITVTVRNALSGDAAATLTIDAKASISTLLALANEEIDGSKAFKFLLDGEEIEPGQRPMSDNGIQDGSELQAVAVRRTPAMVELRQTCPNQRGYGYHCHDTPLLRVCSNDPEAFWVTWFKRERDENGKYTRIAQLTDLAKPDANLVQVRGISHDEHVLALWGRCPLVATVQEDTEELRYRGSRPTPPTNCISLKLADGNQRPIWTLKDWPTIGEDLASDANRTFIFTQGLFTNDKHFYCTAQLCENDDRDADDEVYVLEATVVFGEPESPREIPTKLQFTKWSRLSPLPPDVADGCGDYHRLDFLCSTETDLVMQSAETVFAVDRQTLEQRVLVKEQLDTGHSGPKNYRVFDPKLLCVFSFVDKSLPIDKEAPPCWVRRWDPVFPTRLEQAQRGLPPQQQEEEQQQPQQQLNQMASRPNKSLSDATYDSGVYIEVCQGDLTIDGFSDSFCMLAAQYIPSVDSILVLDAECGLWSISCKDARWA